MLSIFLLENRTNERRFLFLILESLLRSFLYLSAASCSGSFHSPAWDIPGIKISSFGILCIFNLVDSIFYSDPDPGKITKLISKLLLKVICYILNLKSHFPYILYLRIRIRNPNPHHCN